MFPRNPLTITRVLSGLSKTLNIVNQSIPIYKEIKPMIGNARKVMSVLKEFKTTPSIKDPKKAIDIKEKEVTNNVLPSSNLTFFQ